MSHTNISGAAERQLRIFLPNFCIFIPFNSNKKFVLLYKIHNYCLYFMCAVCYIIIYSIIVILLLLKYAVRGNEHE